MGGGVKILMSDCETIIYGFGFAVLFLLYESSAGISTFLRRLFWILTLKLLSRAPIPQAKPIPKPLGPQP